MIAKRLSLWSNRSGAAAAEMALVAPLLVTIMFGSLELGKYFWDEHLVLKAVRDGARFASRQSFTTDCGDTATNETQIKNLVRFGKTAPVDGVDVPRLHYWTDNSTITVTVSCYANEGEDDARIYEGLYAARAELPIVTVSADVPYSPIVGSFGFDAEGISLNAQSQSTVFGL